MKKIKLFLLGFIVFIVFTHALACKKSHHDLSPKPIVTGLTLGKIISNNFTLSHYDTALLKNSLLDSLTGLTKYTVFASEDNGYPEFNNSFYNSENYFYTQFQNGLDPLTYSRFVRYSIIPGDYILSTIPFGFNTRLKTLLGDSIFLGKYLSHGDTLYSINGVPISPHDLGANNGHLNIVQKAISPPPNTNLFTTIAGSQPLTLFGNDPNYLNGDVIQTDHYSISVFAYLLGASDYADTLKSKNNYTVFAPSNISLSGDDAYSLNNLSKLTKDSINKIVGAHIVRGVHFLNEFENLLLTTDTLFYESINHSPLIILIGNDNISDGSTPPFTKSLGIAAKRDTGSYILRYNKNNFQPIFARGASFQHNFTSGVNFLNARVSITTSNGVIHEIDGFLKP